MAVELCNIFKWTNINRKNCSKN